MVPRYGAYHAGMSLLTDYLAQMVEIPRGAFLRGGFEADDEKPVRSVTLASFRLGKTPVTVALWRELGALPEPPAWGWIDDHPVVNVTWDEARAFCRWASRKSGVRLTLPTEAQWECAARGGWESKAYPWGGAFDSGRLWHDAQSTAPVERMERIETRGFGATDLAGNVWEWCLDRYDLAYYASRRARRPNPPGPRRGESRVARGGSWRCASPADFRCARRYRRPPTGRYDDLGFRLAATDR